jgi:D-isomer specific 2-hydroxyacid dehydrogenase, NAD binding domain
MILINTARGPIVDIDALYDAMKDGSVLAAGFDVLPQEPANPQSRLIVAAQRGLAPPPPAADTALGLLYAREHARQSRLRFAYGGALSGRRAAGELRQPAVPGRAELRGRRMEDKVDVLIIGSGASAAAIAWSLAETRMKILCLE